MPDLDFKVTGVEPGTRGLTPLLNFRLQVTNQPPAENIHGVLLQAQIQIRSPQRSYNAREKEKLIELFGLPFQWSATLRNRLWTTTSTVVGAFADQAVARLSVPCTYDLNIAATKCCYALEHGDVPLLFLFSGTVFYAGGDGRLQVQQISWDKECTYRLPVRLWRAMMDEHFPNSAWLYLNRDLFEQLYAYKRSQGLATWDQTMAQLLADSVKQPEVLV